ncbi:MULTISPECIES: TonB-dependent receptor family protein [unclassified Sphingobium]|uniref:TonB-dependent receptor family protein n=1 Tax=unclassified Sphingobium TaxID=2611147 RepID=UPI002223FB13|nr:MULTISPECIES: TonB-dependent receptor [unclassified Sphingobium]MCW2349710.1 iron complex outermembrane receptor protein [Sphingobium sp. B12D2B]MCW2368814.1 iron complex outermembrane receptor protein [Sphingobium sp. B11D3D]
MKTSFIALATMLAMATPAFAEEAADAAADGERTIIVVGQSQTQEAERLARATPGGTDVVRHEDYADKTIVSLRDTLAFSPGVYTQPRYGQEVRLSIRGSGLSRGYHMRGITLLQDGAPINLADDNGDFQELDPIFFERLEVYRGANALRFGSGTLGGAINGVTPTGKDAPGLYLRADAGSFETVRGLAAYGGTSGPADYWVGMSADSSDGDRQHAHRESMRVHGNVGLALSDVVSTRFYASLNRIRQDLPGALTATDVLNNPQKGNFSGDQGRDIDSIRLQNRTRFDWGQTRLDVGAFLNMKDLFHPIYEVIDQKSTDRGVFARLDHDAGILSFTLGGEFRHGETRARQYRNVNGERGALTFDADQTARTANVYGEARLQPVPGVTLIAGGIYADGFRKRTVLLSTGQSGRLAFNEFSPKFGVLIEPTPDIQLFANYSRSAEFPGFGEVFQSVGTPPVSTLIAAIAPQTAWTAEIGTRGQAGMVSWDITAYRATLRDELLQYSPNGTTVPAATFNADRTRHSGIEAAVSLAPTPWLRLRQIWQYSDFHFVSDAVFRNNRLPVVPLNVLRSEVRIGTPALNVAPNLEWVPQGAFADYANSTRTPGYALLGLTAGATLTSGIDLFLDVRNITDKKAIGDISAVITANAASAIYYPVERRAVYGGVRARF